MCILGYHYVDCEVAKQNYLGPALSSASHTVKMIIFSQIQFLRKISKAERFSEAQVRVLV